MLDAPSLIVPAEAIERASHGFWVAFAWTFLGCDLGHLSAAEIVSACSAQWDRLNEGLGDA